MMAPISGESVTSTNWNLSTAAMAMDMNAADADIARVRYAYVLIGALVLVACLLFVVAYFRGRSRRVCSAKKGIYRSPVDVTIVKSVKNDNGYGQRTEDTQNGSPIRTERSSESQVVISNNIAIPSSSSVAVNKSRYPNTFCKKLREYG